MLLPLSVFLAALPSSSLVHGIGNRLPSDVSAVSSIESRQTTTPGALRITENSGICETTPGVYQASGYGDIAEGQSMWFWFFEARNNPDTAPLALWLNGGPGSSSMYGLIQENGPCFITNDSSSIPLNPYSWNEVANMLYIDQPIGTGFSQGNSTITNSLDAAKDLWIFLQIFFQDSRFTKYQEHDFAIWTESYGGHYGPIFSMYFLQQNAAISAGTIHGVTINLKVLAIGNGITDAPSQNPEYLTYSASNPYHPLVSAEDREALNKTYFEPGECAELMAACNDGSDNTTACAQGQRACSSDWLIPLGGDWNNNDVRTNETSYPPDPTPILSNATIQAKIGAVGPWIPSNFDVFESFAGTGEWILSARPSLESVINSGIRTLLYIGDADYTCNYFGVEKMADNLQTNFTALYSQQSFTNWTVAGQATGIYKNAGPFSLLRIWGSGHEVSAYKFGSLDRGQAALQMFSQFMAWGQLHST